MVIGVLIVVAVYEHLIIKREGGLLSCVVELVDNHTALHTALQFPDKMHLQRAFFDGSPGQRVRGVAAASRVVAAIWLRLVQAAGNSTRY